MIDVDDDLPVANEPGENDEPLVTGQVDEDALNNAQSVGNNDGADGDDPGTTTTSGAAGSLAALFSVGADEPLQNFALSSDTSSLESQGLTSNGAALAYDVTGNVVTGYVESGATAGYQAGEDGEVFTLTVDGDGSWQFELLDQLDHETAGTEDNLYIDFSGMISAEDADGDPATAAAGTFVIDVDDDLPVMEAIDDGSANNDPAADATTGNLNLSVGADQPPRVTNITFDTAGIESDGEPVVASFDITTGILTGYVENGVSAGFQSDEDTAVFTLSVNPEGGTSGLYTFDLLQPLDGDIEPIEIGQGSSFGSGPSQSVVVTDDDSGLDLVYATGWVPSGGFTPAEETAWLAGGTPTMTQTSNLNGSTQGWGLANNNFDAGEFIRFDFGPLNDYDDGGGYTPPGGQTIQAVGYVTVSFFNFAVGDKVEFVAHYTDGTSESFVFTDPADPRLTAVGNDLVFTIEAPDGTELAWLDSYMAMGSMKLNLIEVGVRSEEVDANLDFTVTVSDADGDPASDSFTINVADGNTPSAALLGAESEMSVMSIESDNLLASNDYLDSQKAAMSANNAILFGAVAAVGLAAQSAAAPVETHNDGKLSSAVGDSSLSSSSVKLVDSVETTNTNAKFFSGETHTEVAAEEEGSETRTAPEDADSLEQSSDSTIPAADLGELPQGTDVPQGSPTLGSAITADTVMLPPAEMLANSEHEATAVAQSDQAVSKVLADALAGGEGQATIDAALSQIPGGDGAIAGLEQLATPDGGAVPTWHSADTSGFTAANGMLSMEALMLHHDAAPTASS